MERTHAAPARSAARRVSAPSPAHQEAERLRDHLTEVSRRGRGAYAVVSVDRLERARAAIGPAVTRELLAQVVSRLEGLLIDADLAVRLGDGDFGLVLADVAGEADARSRARAILDAFRRPFEATTQKVVLTASIGVSVVGADFGSVDSLIVSAESALRQARDCGGNTVRVADPEAERRANALARRRMRLELELRRALEKDELSVVFDPRLCFETGQVESIEASVRWVHSRLGRVPPAELASVAAEGGLEVELDRWLLRKACAELKSWRTETVRAATVAISISPRHWSSGELVPTVSRVLQDRGVAGARLQLQLPQEALLADVDQAALVIAGLRGLGVSVVAVHSEVSCTVLYELARLRVDGVKLDTGSLRAFDPDFARTVLSSVCGMMKRAGIRCIAGGLESPAEWSLLREVGCDGAQGPLIATPMSSEYLERLARDSVALRHSRPGSASRARKVVQA